MVSGGSHFSREGVELTRVAKMRIKTATALVLNMLRLHVSVAAHNLGKIFTQFQVDRDSKGGKSVFFIHIEKKE